MVIIGIVIVKSVESIATTADCCLVCISTGGTTTSNCHDNYYRIATSAKSI